MNDVTKYELKRAEIKSTLEEIYELSMAMHQDALSLGRYLDCKDHPILTSTNALADKIIDLKVDLDAEIDSIFCSIVSHERYKSNKQYMEEKKKV